MPVLDGVSHGVAVDLEKQALYCTCAFRPKPCVHALALKGLCVREGELFFTATDELPDWVTALLSGVPAEGMLPAFGRASGGKTKAQRRFDRLDRAARGFDDLEAWLLDTARRGFATVVSEDSKWWEGIAARMADASMTGLSRTLRLIGQIPPAAPDWADQTAGVFAGCYLAVRVFRKRDTLPDNLLCDLQNFIGISTRKEEVMDSGERLHDTWAVVGQVEERLEEKLFVRRSWLLGAKTNRYALLLDYSFGNDSFPPAFEAGSIRQGGLVFYPSSFPLRALTLGDLSPVPKRVEKLPGFEDFALFSQSWAAALALQPWLSIFPAVLTEVIPQLLGKIFVVVDKNGRSLPLKVAENTGWRMVALGGGTAISLFGEWDGVSFRPFSVVAEGRFVSL